MRLRLALPFVFFVALCLFMPNRPGDAAPVPPAARISNKYVLDNAFAIAVVNTKPILESALYKGNYEAMVAGHLKEEPVASILAAAAFDPRKDIDFIFLMLDPSSFGSPGDPKKVGGDGPSVLFQGRFDAKAVDAAIEKINSFHAGAVKVHARGDAKIFEIVGGPMWAALLDKENAMLSGSKATIEAAMDKAAGKATTTLTNKTFSDLFGKIKGDDALSVAAAGEMICNASYTADATGRFEAKFTTLSQVGVEAVQGTADVAELVKFMATVSSKDAAGAKNLAKTSADGLQVTAGFVEKQPGFENLAKAMRAIKFDSKDSSMTLEGTADSDTMQNVLKGMLFRGAPVPPEPK